MKFGALRERISIRVRSAERGAAGSRSETWNEAALLWARIEELSSDELLSLSLNQTQRTIRVITRKYSLLQPGVRVVWRGVTFEVEGVPVEYREDRGYVEFLAYNRGQL